ncbi:EH domain-containing protein 1 [Hydra vulgaris]|uniref:EH domain-containing protein 1 n=1 Tax=Hydra vulgaris TaxID=6087 RepID=A0ABM4C0Y9_HYDVU
MSRWNKKQKVPEVFDSVAEGLVRLYKEKLLPLEECYKFHEFHSPKLEDSDFLGKPMVLLVGQYSTGKTTFIKYLLEQDFPGMRVGPEPTTDCFTAVMHGAYDRIIPGNALVVDANKNFRSLSAFGNAFLNRLSCAETKNPVLETITLIDTPGILSGEKQSINRGYDFTAILEWFAERVDRIILLFDAHKLDISDEFRRGIEALHGFDDKIRIVLNKADMISTQQLMRVYGAMMWSLGKVIQTPEVTRVYVGSFWDQPLRIDDNRKLFELEENDLFNDLQTLPKNAALRKLNDLIKRARLAKVHAYIISALKDEMPAVFGKEKKKAELIKNLRDTYRRIQGQYEISPGDFPNLERMQENLELHDFSKFPNLRPKLIEKVDQMLSEDIARLMAMLPQEAETRGDSQVVRGGVFSSAEGELNPFATGAAEGYALGAGTSQWVVNSSGDKQKYDKLFNELNPIEGKITGAAAKKEMMKSKLPKNALAKIWSLADIDKDGHLDEEEFALAMYLIEVKIKDDDEIPSALPEHLVPPGKRRLVFGAAHGN